MKNSCCRCKAPADFYQEYSGRHLCFFHLKEDVMTRFRRTIRKQGGLGNGIVIGVIGGNFVNFLLYCIADLLKGRKGISILYLVTEEQNSETKGLFRLIPSSINFRIVYTNKDQFEEMINESGGDRIFSVRCLEDEAAQTLRDLLTGNYPDLIKRNTTQGIRYIAPFLEIPEEEIYLAAIFSGIEMGGYSPHSDDPVYNLLIKLREKHSSVSYSLVSYLSRLRESGTFCNAEKNNYQDHECQS